MFYGDLQLIDIIIFAGVTIFLIFRLKNVLGKKGGFEKNPKKEAEQEEGATEKAVVTEPPELSEDLAEFKNAYEIIKDFDHKAFLEGAKNAFEIIINSFNGGDKKTLKKLLTPEVYKSFEEVINKNENSPEYQFFSLSIKKILKVVEEDKKIKITIAFFSEQFKNNDESTVIKKNDTWTFEKNTESTDQSWLLSST
mgnify:FL=1|jgi:predicted lipid-binding transport protein (Tim44 family)|tara:strand:- start:60 stop:647 length:588 start_codon:yes stop_codon:yes gene_type:complete